MHQSKLIRGRETCTDVRALRKEFVAHSLFHTPFLHWMARSAEGSRLSYSPEHSLDHCLLKSLKRKEHEFVHSVLYSLLYSRLKSRLVQGPVPRLVPL